MPGRAWILHGMEPCVWFDSQLICLISLRNHDLLTSLDVLTTGSYRRLPTIIQVHLTVLVLHFPRLKRFPENRYPPDATN